MIELFDEDIQDTGRRSSKGNQLKWKNGDFWYKADYTGYEGLAEYLVSKALAASDFKEKQYVRYEPEQIRYKKMIYNGAKSRNFLQNDWQLVTLERLFWQRYGKSLTKAIWKIPDVENRLSFLVEQVIAMTQLTDFGKYISQMLTVDAFFLNEDRHMHNIAVLMNGAGEFAYCPLFDHGAALLADTTMDYPLGEDVLALMSQVKAKTVSASFDEALDAAEKLYGSHLKFSFGKKEVKSWLLGAGCYSEEIKERAAEIFYQQMRKYQYLMK